MPRNTRGAVQLSVNILVVIILSLVVLAGGIVFLYQFIDTADEVKEELDLRTQEEIERLLIRDGQRVALPLHRATVPGGKDHIFGLGILNTGQDFGPDFYVNIELRKLVDGNNDNVVTDEIKAQAQEWLLYSTEPFVIEQGDHQKAKILVQVPKDAPKGEYIFVATVLEGGERYGNPQTFYVNVI